MISRLSLPIGLEVTTLWVAALAWSAVSSARGFVLSTGPIGSVAAVVGLVIWGALTGRLRPILAIAILIGGAVSGFSSGSREAATLAGVPLGTAVAGEFEINSDARGGRYGDSAFLVTSEDLPPLLIRSGINTPIAGERWWIEGLVNGPPGRWRGVPYAGTVSGRRLERASHGSLLGQSANTVRGRVGEVFGAGGSAGGLVAGFLIGDTSEVSSGDLEAMRAAGLSHFVAVSGSNVALFLGLWWLATGFLGAGPARRAVLGLVGLVFFVWVTRWEPSVVRAASMAGLVLIAKAVGMPITGWNALGLSLTSLVLVSGELVDSLGFQLSVLATVGVMAGHRLFAIRGVGPVVSATVGAQVAVAPLLLITFGGVPLASPLANLAAVPLVTGATATGAVAAMTDLRPVVAVASTLAQWVLEIAHFAAGLPTVGWGGLVVLGLAGWGWRWAPVRLMALVVGASIVGWAFVAPPPVSSGIVVLDVGQGDAILLLGPRGGVVLVDGGPEELVIVRKLRDYGVTHVDLVVNTHPHHDHIAGLVGVLEAVPVGAVWHSGYEPWDDNDLLGLADRLGIPTSVPQPGWEIDVGGIRLEVAGPQRRYASPNDQSIVMVADVDGISVTLSGDIETFAQADLGPIASDVLKVPHQGAATSDLAWLAASAGSVAVISVGPNNFGHPDPDVIATLQAAGAIVLRTDEEGDVALIAPLDAPGG